MGTQINVKYDRTLNPRQLTALPAAMRYADSIES